MKLRKERTTEGFNEHYIVLKDGRGIRPKERGFYGHLMILLYNRGIVTKGGMEGVVGIRCFKVGELY